MTRSTAKSCPACGRAMAKAGSKLWRCDYCRSAWKSVICVPSCRAQSRRVTDEFCREHKKMMDARLGRGKEGEVDG